MLPSPTTTSRGAGSLAGNHDPRWLQVLLVGMSAAFIGLFLVLPLFGPSTIRDAAGIGVETVLDVNFWINNVSVRNTIFGVRTVSFRHELLKTDDLISGAALDRYTFIRDGYLQRRRNLVYDGNPPREKDPYEEEDDPAADEGKGRPGPPADGTDVKPSSAPQPAQ